MTKNKAGGKCEYKKIPIIVNLDPSCDKGARFLDLQGKMSKNAKQLAIQWVGVDSAGINLHA